MFFLEIIKKVDYYVFSVKIYRNYPNKIVTVIISTGFNSIKPPKMLKILK